MSTSIKDRGRKGGNQIRTILQHPRANLNVISPGRNLSDFTISPTPMTTRERHLVSGALVMGLCRVLPCAVLLFLMT